MTRQFVDTTELNHLVNKFYVSKNTIFSKIATIFDFGVIAMIVECK